MIADPTKQNVNEMKKQKFEYLIMNLNARKIEPKLKFVLFY